jgi:hypothetical protein
VKATPGDYGVFQRVDGTFDVFKVTISGEREVRREKLQELKTAYEIARAGLEDDGGTQVWFSHHSRPESLSHTTTATEPLPERRAFWTHALN